MYSGGVEVERAFIGAGCNRIVNNVSWGACDLVAFGAQNAVAIFCPKTAQILTTLPGHNAVVNCTQWLPSNKYAFEVAFGAQNAVDIFCPKTAQILTTLPGHKAVVNCT